MYAAEHNLAAGHPLHPLDVEERADVRVVGRRGSPPPDRPVPTPATLCSCSSWRHCVALSLSPWQHCACTTITLTLPVRCCEALKSPRGRSSISLSFDIYPYLNPRTFCGAKTDALIEADVTQPQCHRRSISFLFFSSSLLTTVARRCLNSALGD